jgi:biotin-dependent carboxylase-like uncharacterized protein
VLEVIDPGLLSSLQDAGRPGLAHFGIGRAGAADEPARRLANALVGNEAEACVIEMTLRGATVRLQRDAWVALTGAPLPRARIGERPLPMWTSCHVGAGSVLELGPMRAGCRSYLAVSGGVDVPPRLGSRSTDLNAGFGAGPGRALRKGDRLPLGRPALQPAPRRRRWSLDPRPWFDDPEPAPLRLLAGTHTGLLDPMARHLLESESFRVSADSNRVGVRLQGVALELREPLDMVSEGSVAGVMQLPPGGEPIILGVEHPVTGGYPRIAQLAAVDLPRLAQCRPGAGVRFRWIDRGQARLALAERDRQLDCLRHDVLRRLQEPA